MPLTAKSVPRGGSTTTLGATVTAEGVNFAVYSETASAIWVCLFDEADREIGRFELDGHENHVHSGLIAGIGAGARYGVRADGRYDPAQAFHFDPARLLVDPYAKRIDRPFVLNPDLLHPREAEFDTAALVPKGVVQGASTKPANPRRKPADFVYELNIRGYTRQHPAIPEKLRGTMAALGAPQIIDHLVKLGVDTVELLPVAAFIDDLHLPRLGLTNAWGYNPVTYFALDPRIAPNGMAELRTVTDAYRKAGISVLLDVVFNHTGESDANGPILSMKGLDARTYYRHVEIEGKQVLVNDTGTGNTLRCDHPAVQLLVLDNLHHWIAEGGVSGFRFDLAPVLGRDPGFNPHAVLLDAIKADPLLTKCLLIAEPWDSGPGGYQLGAFGREFREWNDTYRDQVRSFWRGDEGKIGALASKISGSSEIFDVYGRRPSHGVNFIAAHDGFTLRDLVTFADKHNEANGENNRDGHRHNLSWNHGVEGETADPAIISARKRDVRALLATLFVSRGTAMLTQGDELWRTQRGNNNAYAQDNDTTWLDWANADRELSGFVSRLATLRKDHPALNHDHFLTGVERAGRRDVVWLHPDGREMHVGDWNASGASTLGMHLRVADDEVLVWINRSVGGVNAHLPHGPWTVELDSALALPMGEVRAHLLLPPRSVVVLAPAAVADAAADQG